MGCCKSLFGSLFKLILILINIPLVLIGVVFIFFGIMAAFFFATLLSWFNNLLLNGQMDENVTTAIENFLSYIDDYAVGVGVTLLVVGIVVFLTAFLGGFGACCNSYCMMVTYSVLMGIVALGSMAAAIVFLVDSAILITPITSEFLTTVETSYQDPDNPARKGDLTGIEPKMVAYASVFRLLPCCGVTNYTDFQRSGLWDKVYYYETQGVNVTAVVPVMCCNKDNKYVATSSAAWPYSTPGSANKLDTTCITNPNAQNSFIETSCIQYLTGDVNSILAWVVFGLAFAMIVIFFVAVIVTVLVRKKSRGDDGFEMN